MNDPYNELRYHGIKSTKISITLYTGNDRYYENQNIIFDLLDKVKKDIKNKKADIIDHLDKDDILKFENKGNHSSFYIVEICQE